MRGWIRWPLVVLTSVVVGACASGGPAEETSGDTSGIAVTVNNDLVPPASVTVYIRPETGSRRRLGALNPSQRQTFSYSTGLPNQEFVLEAEVSGGRTHRSNPFVLSGVQAVTWDVSVATVRTSE